jgi:rod shape-determining protein MreC
MFIRRKFSVFIIFILIVFVLLTFQGIRDNPETSSISFLRYPFILIERGLSASIREVKGFFQHYILLIGIEEENRMLKAELERQLEENRRYQEIKLENQRLREILELKHQRIDYVTSAEVFARDPSNWFQVLWINKGKVQGVEKDMVAVTPRGIVGKVHTVNTDISSIILITDINSSVAARVQNSRVEGIVEGRGRGVCYLKYVPHDVEVAQGEAVITSGFDGIYPEGLLIGFIKSVKKQTGEFFQVIEVAPSQNLNSLEEVALLKR